MYLEHDESAYIFAEPSQLFKLHLSDIPYHIIKLLTPPYKTRLRTLSSSSRWAEASEASSLATQDADKTEPNATSHKSELSALSKQDKFTCPP